MASIIIESDSTDNLALLSKIAEKLGDRVHTLTTDELEEIEFGSLLNEIKTSENASRESVMQKLG